MDGQHCDNCRFAADHGSNQAFACLRYPPQVIHLSEGDYAAFPKVYGPEWCGEWRGKPEPSP